MANDEFDNARADKAILAEMNAKFAAERERRRAEDPNKGRLTDAICPECRGSGVDAKLSVFEWDEFNPEGYWHTEPCEVCYGSGVSQGMNAAMEQLALQEHQLREANKLLERLAEKVKQWRDWIENTPEPHEDAFAKEAEDVLGGLQDEFIELQGRLFPEGE